MIDRSHAPQPGVPVAPPRKLVTFQLDGEPVKVPEGTTLLSACRARHDAEDVPTLCWGDTMTARNACRVCMVELEGSRTLVPACSRVVEAGMVVSTGSERVRHARRMVLELLGSTVDLSCTPNVADWNDRYDVDIARHGVAAPAVDRDAAIAGEHHEPAGTEAATVAQVAKIDNELFVREYAKCILCYQCVDACGEQWQNTFAIGVAGRGFDTRISTEFNTPLADGACVFCGNCVEVCPTGALSFKTEFDLRQAGNWRPESQTVTDTICPYCGVGCTLSLHVQDNEIVKVTSPHDQPVTSGNLCIKGRFGSAHPQS